MAAAARTIARTMARAGGTAGRRGPLWGARTQTTGQTGERAAAVPSLTGLRFCAALAVVLFHFTNNWYRDLVPAAGLWWPVHTLLGQGYLAVNLFFVLSGFILAHTYLDAAGGLRGTTRAFWVARGARIYPLHLLGVALAGLLLLVPSEPQPVPHPLASLLGTLLLVQTWLPWHALGFNGPSWTLAAEAFFYALFPLLAPLLARCAVRRLVVVSALAWLAGLVLPVLYVAGALGPHPAACSDMGPCLLRTLQMVPLLRLPAFVLGIAAALLWRRGALGVPVGPTLLLLLAGLLAAPLLPTVLVQVGLLDPLFALLIVALAGNRGALARGLGSAPLILLGEASYALYLLHWSLWEALKGLVGGIPRPVAQAQAGSAALPAYGLLYLGLALCVSVLAYRLVETPARRVLRAHLSPVACRPSPGPHCAYVTAQDSSVMPGEPAPA